MIHNKTQQLIQSFLKKDSKVLDVGGGKNSFIGSTHILDLNEPDRELSTKLRNFKRENYLVRDIFDIPWPYEDKFFDFSICSQTLEDLRDPIAVCKELKRVSKAGYISCPTRAQESNNKIFNRSKIEKNLIGYYHHRWFVEIENDCLVFIHKNDILYNNSNLIINKVGQKNLNFFWSEDFKFKEKIIAKENSVNDCLVFKTEHDKWYKKSKKTYEETRYNYVPLEFNQLTNNFSHEFEPSNDLVNNIKFYAKSILD
tara:strand:- start:143 stop:910 length:768 start_codon:yes stop_codon:yes gene_type:complete